VIKSVADKRTARFLAGRRVKEFAAIERQSQRRLTILNNATSLTDLAGLSSNRLEALKGNRAGLYSIRINDQYRVCFRFIDGDAYDVEIVDYH
jgi:toxin HigB-1